MIVQPTYNNIELKLTFKIENYKQSNLNNYQIVLKLNEILHVQQNFYLIIKATPKHHAVIRAI
jgi:hypothetical protein